MRWLGRIAWVVGACLIVVGASAAVVFSKGSAARAQSSRAASRQSPSAATTVTTAQLSYRVGLPPAAYQVDENGRPSDIASGNWLYADLLSAPADGPSDVAARADALFHADMVARDLQSSGAALNGITLEYLAAGAMTPVFEARFPPYPAGAASTVDAASVANAIASDARATGLTNATVSVVPASIGVPVVSAVAANPADWLQKYANTINGTLFLSKQLDGYQLEVRDSTGSVAFATYASVSLGTSGHWIRDDLKGDLTDMFSSAHDSFAP